MSALREVAVGLVQRFSLRAAGGDLLRQAVTSFIDNLSRAKVAATRGTFVHPQKQPKKWPDVPSESRIQAL